MLFFGTYEHNLDAKNRLMLPSKFRTNISGNLYCNIGFDGSLSLYTEESFTKLSAKLSELSFNNKKEREYIRAIYANTIELEIDKIGRIQIPTYIVNKFKIPKSLAIIGVGDHIEIWDKEKWDNYSSESLKNFDEIAEDIKNVWKTYPGFTKRSN